MLQFRLDGPFLDQILETGLMEMFLWTVGSFLIFCKKLVSTVSLAIFHRGDYQSDPAFSRKQQISDYCIFGEFHNLQVGRRLALEEWIHVDGPAYMSIDP